mgnify:CR=1 FL=1
MTPGVALTLCSACGWSGLPERLWCPRCGGSSLRPALVHAGRVRETTAVRRMVGGGPPVRLGTVQLSDGARVVARLEPDATAGVRVRLYTDGGAAVARPL